MIAGETLGMYLNSHFICLISYNPYACALYSLFIYLFIGELEKFLEVMPVLQEFDPDISRILRI